MVIQNKRIESSQNHNNNSINSFVNLNVLTGSSSSSKSKSNELTEKTLHISHSTKRKQQFDPDPDFVVNLRNKGPTIQDVEEQNSNGCLSDNESNSQNTRSLAATNKKSSCGQTIKNERIETSLPTVFQDEGLSEYNSSRLNNVNNIQPHTQGKFYTFKIPYVILSDI